MTIIGQELKKWRDSLNIGELDKYDITVANIIINNFDELREAGGTARGKRSAKFAEMINKKKNICDTSLSNVSEGQSYSEKRIKRIISLEVDSFRGFATSRNFWLDKQYVFLYGPNGSGKTSFSEALEYGLLGNIEEADADNIKLPSYIKNTYTKQGKQPIIRCLFDDGSEGEAKISYDTYRFSFVEKNRIMEFSHLSRLNTKNQGERMAALFGLSEFSSFIQGFSSSIDEKYLPISSITEQSFKQRQAIREQKQQELDRLQEELNELYEKQQRKITALKQKDNSIETIQQAIEYYDNPKNGILTLKLQDKNKSTMEIIEYQSYIEIKNCCTKIQKGFSNIRDKRERLADKALEVNYKKLFEIISELDETGVCPACGTTISRAERNPYLYAKKKILEYKEIDTLTQEIQNEAYNVKNIIDELNNIITNNKELIKLIGVNPETRNIIGIDDIKTMNDSIKTWIDFSSSIDSLLDNDINEKITKYNIISDNKNKSYEKEIEELKKNEKELVTLSAQIEEKRKLIAGTNKFIEEFDENVKEILLTINKEKKQAEFNSNIVKSYEKIILNLSTYMKKLPELIAQNLEDKIVDYYNIINQGDASFEMLSSVCLPSANSNKLVLTFMDGSSSEALHVLSEGHIKILGLAILLAKAVKDNMNFIIFDDIVNAIDDEHRNGVANLLMKYEDFKNIQIILSTHGDQFITKLKDRLGAKRSNKDAVIYKFLPADSLNERGVVVEYSDAKTPIEAAQIKYKNNELKDAASKCRQAMESISYNLWNKISQSSNGQISVAMRTPKTQPDLYSIVDALIKKTKTMSGMEPIRDNLQEIKKTDNWRVLNKGVHFEDEQQEFERDDIKCVLDILIELDNQVRNIKIQNIASVY